MTGRNIHWGVKCELSPRGGIRAEKRISPDDVDGAIRQLIAGNSRTEGAQKEGGILGIGQPGLETPRTLPIQHRHFTAKPIHVENDGGRTTTRTKTLQRHLS